MNRMRMLKEKALLLVTAGFVAAGSLCGGAAAQAASMKYVGVHYSAWFDDEYQWFRAWDPESSRIDFESGAYWPGATTGTAFGGGPRSTGHGSLSGWEGNYWADSYAGGETATGTLQSGNFVLKADTFKFKAAGYDGPSGTSNQNYYYLKRASDNAVLFSAKPPQSDTFATIEWNTSGYKNTEVYFQAVDNNNGSTFAWLAVDSIMHDINPTTVEPVLGLYTSDYNTGRAHAQTLKTMGVDFAIIDNTNNTVWGPSHPQTHLQTDYIYNNTKEIADGFASVAGGPKVSVLLSVTNWDSNVTQVNRSITKNYDSGTPYMYYPWIPSNAGDLFLQKVGMIYNDMASDSDKYFYYEGKPILFLWVSPAATAYDENGADQLVNGKMPDTWNPVVPNTGGSTIRSLFTIRWVGAFQAGSGNSKFVPSTGDTTKAYNGHWSWEDSTPQTWASRSGGNGDTPEAVTTTPFYRVPSLAGRNGGATFRNQWERAFDVDPLITVIHTWNEFSTGDEPSSEYSNSIEPTTNYFTDTYKNWAQGYIAHFKKSRMDIALYDSFSGGRQMHFKNRKEDYAGSTFTFGFESAYGIDLGTSSVEVVSGDFDGNGHTDFAIRDIATGQIKIRYSPFFSAIAVGGQPGEKSLTLEAGSRYRMFTGDFNNDGKADIGFYDSTGGGFVVRYNDGGSGFGTSYSWAWALSGNYQFGAADINNDGRDDIVFRNPATGIITFALTKTDDLQTKPTSIYTYGWATGTGYQLFTGDVNGDGYGDIGLRDTTLGRFYMLDNQNSITGTTWNFSNQQEFDWAAGAHYLPLTGDWR